MPLEIAHAWVGLQLIDKIPRNEQEAFLVGNLWPDIRYPAGIDRKITHVNQLPASLSPAFAQGMWLHRWTDNVWDKNAHELFGCEWFSDPVHIYALKTAFDIDVFDVYRTSHISLPENSTADELLWNIPTNTIQEWHRFLNKYLVISYKPEMLVDFKNIFRANQELQVMIQRTLDQGIDTTELRQRMADACTNLEFPHDPYEKIEQVRLV